MTPKEILRRKYKRLYKECLRKLTQTPEFITYWKKLGLYQEGYHFEQIQEKHREDSVNILSYQFSCSGSTITNRIFMNGIKPRSQIFLSDVNWSIKTGLGFVVLNKHNKVCLVCIAYDICDKNPNLYTITDKKLLHLFQMDEIQANNCNIWCHKIGDKIKRKEWKMGEVLYGNVAAVTPSLAHKGLGRNGLARVISGMMGYKFHYAQMVNKITVKWAKRMSQLPYIYVDKPLNFSNFTFDDGTNMSYYYDQLEIKYGLTTDYINKLKEQSFICLYIVDYGKISNKSFGGWVEIWKQCIDVINNVLVSKL